MRDLSAPVHTGDLRTEPFVCKEPWNPERPRVLVVACSDGRLQANVDEFLSTHLGVTQYDRLYLPGGPGALAASGAEFCRSDQHRSELSFLLKMHLLESIVLLFHGPSADGPPIACCADYSRFLGTQDARVIARQQESDWKEVRRFLLSRAPGLDVRGYRCEVGLDGVIAFVPLG